MNYLQNETRFTISVLQVIPEYLKLHVTLTVCNQFVGVFVYFNIDCTLFPLLVYDTTNTIFTNRFSSFSLPNSTIDLLIILIIQFLFFLRVTSSSLIVTFLGEWTVYRRIRNLFDLQLHPSFVRVSTPNFYSKTDTILLTSPLTEIILW